jgi:hypothetical protein
VQRDVSPDELRGMLLMRRAEIEQPKPSKPGNWAWSALQPSRVKVVYRTTS